MGGNELFDKIWKDRLDAPDLDGIIEAHIKHRLPFLEFLAKHLRPGARVLEVGCGFGIDSAWLAGKAGARCFGVDLSATSIQVALKAGKRLGVPPIGAVMDAHGLAFLDETFDLVFSQGLLEHFDNPLPVLAQQAQAARKDGLIVVNVPQKFNPYTLYKHKRLKEGTWEFGWETEYSFGQLRRLGEKLGLRVVGRMGHGYEKGKDYGFYEFRDFTRRMASTAKYPILNRPGSLGERAWSVLEKRFGHCFCLNLAVVFSREAGR